MRIGCFLSYLAALPSPVGAEPAVLASDAGTAVCRAHGAARHAGSLRGAGSRGPDGDVRPRVVGLSALSRVDVFATGVRLRLGSTPAWTVRWSRHEEEPEPRLRQGRRRAARRQLATFSTPNGIRLRSSVRRSRCFDAWSMSMPTG